MKNNEEKLHNETLAIARSLMEKDTSLKDWVISKFPELAESEDEKIRKEIIEYLNEREILEIHTETKVNKRWISWLEKQKPLRQCADYYNSEGELKMPRISDFENELANILFEREYDGSTETEEDIQKGKLDYELAAIQLAPRLLSLSIIQQPTEWSEEDEHRRTDAIYFLETAKKHYASTIEIDATIEWLKSLKPQPYQNQTHTDSFLKPASIG